MVVVLESISLLWCPQTRSNCLKKTVRQETEKIEMFYPSYLLHRTVLEYSSTCYCTYKVATGRQYQFLSLIRLIEVKKQYSCTNTLIVDEIDNRATTSL
jgi:hypothetical protein